MTLAAFEYNKAQPHLIIKQVCEAKDWPYIFHYKAPKGFIFVNIPHKQLLKEIIKMTTRMAPKVPAPHPCCRFPARAAASAVSFALRSPPPPLPLITDTFPRR